MKVTDLMIGDYVSFNGTICKVTELSCKKWVKVETEQGELRVNNDYILDSLKPIPLTAEILESNGWKAENLGDEYRDDWYYTIKNGFDIHIAEEEDEDRYEVELCNCDNIWLQYVHELQHALKLCWTTFKEIKL